jgi:hypothetical protein
MGFFNNDDGGENYILPSYEDGPEVIFDVAMADMTKDGGNII